MSILCVGDSYMPASQFEAVFGRRYTDTDVHYLQMHPEPVAEADLAGVDESEGDPRR